MNKSNREVVLAPMPHFSLSRTTSDQGLRHWAGYHQSSPVTLARPCPANQPNLEGTDLRYALFRRGAILHRASTGLVTNMGIVSIAGHSGHHKGLCSVGLSTAAVQLMLSGCKLSLKPDLVTLNRRPYYLLDNICCLVPHVL